MNGDLFLYSLHFDRRYLLKSLHLCPVYRTGQRRYVSTVCSRVSCQVTKISQMNADLFLHPLFLTEDIPSISSSLSRSLARYAIAHFIHLLSVITLPPYWPRRILPQALGMYDYKILHTSNIHRGRDDGVSRIQILSVVPTLLSSELACVEIVSVDSRRPGSGS